MHFVLEKGLHDLPPLLPATLIGGADKNLIAFFHCLPISQVSILDQTQVWVPFPTC